jgi:DNA end-binding protein Ku
LSFGLVSIPVELFPAHKSSVAGLRMLDADGTPLARRYYCPADDTEVDAEHLVRGYELEDGRLVVVTDEELEALAPKKSREIDLRLFVDRDSIHPLYFERSYFLAPGEQSGKAYRLLGAVMERSRRAGIATFVMRDREYLVAIFAEGGLLRAETLRFSGEVRSSEDVGLPKPGKPAALRVKQLGAAVAALEADRWVTADLTDPHMEALRKVVEEKYRRGKDVVSSVGEAPREGAEIIDPMEVLKKSLAASGLVKKVASAQRAPASKREKSGRAARSKTARRAKTLRKESTIPTRKPARKVATPGRAKTGATQRPAEKARARGRPEAATQGRAKTGATQRPAKKTAPRGRAKTAA